MRLDDRERPVPRPSQESVSMITSAQCSPDFSRAIKLHLITRAEWGDLTHEHCPTEVGHYDWGATPFIRIGSWALPS